MIRSRRAVVTLACLALAVTLAAQPAAPAGALVDALRPALPFPGAAADGDVPADGSAEARWFVVWPGPADPPRVVVKANPLNREVQQAGADAMARINDAVAAAERRAQAAYERALEELRRTGSAADLPGITLDDEGVEGEKIDAELELVIAVEPAQPFDLESGEAPVVTPAPAGAAWSWLVSVPANIYRAGSADAARERFRPAESRLYFGDVSRPAITRRGDAPVFDVAVTAPDAAVAVVLRGNPDLLAEVVARADWSRVQRQ